MKRRDFLKRAGVGMSSLALLPLAGTVEPLFEVPFQADQSNQAPYLKNRAVARKVMVLGLDGMDPMLLRRFVAEGALPNFKRLIERGYFSELETTLPPQSPVAWASFITGTNPGGHGIFDFLHRDPSTFMPHLSTSRSFGGGKKIEIGSWNIPLEKGRIELLRRGTPYWSVLEAHDIPCFVIQIPSNFPVIPSKSYQISGMGTPDLLGTYGTFTLVTEAPSEMKKMEGGRVVRIEMSGHRGTVSLQGPPNEFAVDKEPSMVSLSIYRDPRADVLRLILQENDIILQRGEWSEWLPVSFAVVPLVASVSGMVRILVKQVHPVLELYISPINVDPVNPSLPISSPETFSRDLAYSVGRFYTQGFPADTKALSRGVLSDEEYFAQAKIVLAENRRVFEYTFKDFTEGCYFFYFSNLDQNSHMLWRCMDPTHPLHDPHASPEIKGALRWFYQQMDEVLGRALSKVDVATRLFIVSDHGFSSFSREFHLSRWLIDEGYTVLGENPKYVRGEGNFFPSVDWSRTKAYALGLNGVYINRRGRERQGSVDASEAERIKREIVEKLPTVRDPRGGQRIIRAAYDASRSYSGPYLDVAPDILVGYERGYRISDESAFGKFPTDLVGDRTDKWAADHCIDPSAVPGVLVTNCTCRVSAPAIWDLAPTILKQFGIVPPESMTGRVITEA